LYDTFIVFVSYVSISNIIHKDYRLKYTMYCSIL